ncbi:Outer dense fiber protein 3 [Myotis davidii]|uniref:Outer dense fiber protein 3 n=1 Tax=Myotis davidii TaxID=225400 RepID=L5LKG1_MYODS|nr:Outer dense fiber protein 3 [Myotis davidii]
MTEEVWVGTWRPHRPRGPIMALYSSPGPKYLIPPTTGRCLEPGRGGRDQPGAGWAWGGVRRDGEGLGWPGARPDSQHQPLWGQEAGELGRSPGCSESPPTGFMKHTPTKLRAPAYSFRGAPLLLAENCSPGPRYSVNPKVLRTGKDLGPAFSILGRYHTKTTMTPGPTPGPAAYHQTDMQVTKFKAPQYTIAARVEPPGDKTLKPGPGAHSPEKVTLTKPCAPIVTFGIKHSDYMTPLILQVD